MSSFPESLGICISDPLLVLDTTATRTFVGVASKGFWLATQWSERPALEGLFEGLDHCLTVSGLPEGLDSLGGCLYCEGPGSTLGLRVTQMAFDTWDLFLKKPLPRIAYTTFDWMAYRCLQSGVRRAHMLSEYKNAQWQYRTLEDGRLGPLCFCDTQDLYALQYPVYHLKMRSHWSSPPIPVTIFDESPLGFYPACVKKCE